MPKFPYGIDALVLSDGNVKIALYDDLSGGLFSYVGMNRMVELLDELNMGKTDSMAEIHDGFTGTSISFSSRSVKGKMHVNIIDSAWSCNFLCDMNLFTDFMKKVTADRKPPFRTGMKTTHCSQKYYEIHSDQKYREMTTWKSSIINQGE